MSLSLKEAETAAYLDPSQENLVVYVKRLEEALENVGGQSAEIERLEDELEAAPTREDMDDLRDRIQDLERDLDEARAGAGK